MQADAPPAYPAWATAPVALPPRTRLYHLAPIGVGTAWTESLTSYLARLAEAHCVRVSTLLAAEIGPRVAEQGHVQALAQRNWTHYSQAINGTGATAQAVVDVLQALTGRPDVHFPTMLTWAPVLAPLGLLRQERAWCPQCYQDWQEQDRLLYDPLLWALPVVTGCPRHGCDLRQQCPRCRKAQLPLTVAVRLGHCAHCGAWLGMARAQPRDLSAPALSPWACWVATVVGNLITAAPAVITAPTKLGLVAAIDRYTVGTPEGGRLAVAQAAHISHEHLWAWRRGHTLPTLPLLLRLCGSLGMEPLQFLLPDLATPLPPRLPPTGLIVPPSKPRGLRNGDDHAAIRRQVDAVLRQDRMPPPPLRQVAQATGHAQGTLRRVCPDLCACLVARWRAHRQAQKRQHQQDLAAAVRRAILEVHAAGLPLTAKRVGAFLPRQAYLRTAVARQAWQDTVRELGLGP